MKQDKIDKLDIGEHDRTCHENHKQRKLAAKGRRAIGSYDIFVKCFQDFSGGIGANEKA